MKVLQTLEGSTVYELDVLSVEALGVDYPSAEQWHALVERGLMEVLDHLDHYTFHVEDPSRGTARELRKFDVSRIVELSRVTQGKLMSMYRHAMDSGLEADPNHKPMNVPLVQQSVRDGIRVSGPFRIPVKDYAATIAEQLGDVDYYVFTLIFPDSEMVSVQAVVFAPGSLR